MIQFIPLCDDVVVHESPAHRGYDVYLFRDAGAGTRKRLQLVQGDNGNWTFAQVGPGTWPDPSIRFDGDTLMKLVAAAADQQPPSTAQARHLDDAIMVRDRLLTMIEEGK